ncbi:Glycosyltransferase AglE [Candidatus Burarchaeum australiense]|nr:Glycosyltransferase AglE [Candidatus Burarchaeum australiense]
MNKLWLSALIVLLLFALFFHLLFSFVPYLVIFLVANFFFVYVAVVYLLTYWEKKPEPRSDRFPSVSIIISAYNSGRTLEKCLQCVTAFDYPSKPQILLVDDASTDNTYEIAKKFKVEIIRNPKNLGKAASINMALGRAKGELVACIDSDTYPQKDALVKMVPLFNAPDVGAVAALICVEKPKTFVQRIQEIEYYASFGFWHTALSQLDGLLVTPGPMSVYSKKALEDVGGFDENNITEDMEIALHLQEKGWKIKLNTDAQVFTDVPQTWKSLFRQRLRWLRGKIFNGFKYNHMIFSSKYGNFGKFVYPISFIIELLGVVVVSRVLWMHIGNFLNMAPGLGNVISADSSLLFNPGTYSNAVFNSSAFFLLFTVIVWSYIIWISFDIAKQKPRLDQIPPLIIFMTLYSSFISFVYFTSMVNEAIGSRRNW